MPGRLFLTHAATEIAQAAGAPVVAAVAPRHNIKPGEELLVLRPGPELVFMRWGMIPSGRVNARGRPVLETIVNARSETVFQKSAFDGVGRAVVPASGWYEWTGPARRKTAWRIASKDGAPLWFAAITDPWVAPGGREILQVATVTCPPNADVRKIHDRMGVLLRPDGIPIWLTGSEDEASKLMVPAPDGSLRVEQADDVDWSGA